MTRAVEKHVEDEIGRMVAAPGPILVGPWLSEVGFEILYWIPMLRWIKERWQIPAERMVVVSRGGTRLWYQGLCERYVDLLDLASPEQFQEMNRSRWERDRRQKQSFVEEQDREVIGWVRKATGLEGQALIHPSLMYSLFWPVFQRRAPLGDLLQRVQFQSQAPAELTPELKAVLPEEYIALRFYFRPSLPETEATRAFVASIVRRVAGRYPVVLLNNGLQLDDHIDCPAEGAITLDHLMTPSTNLDIQTRVIANARAFVGTYGGLCYLGPFVGTPSIAFYSDDRELMPVHLEAARAACRGLGTNLIALHTDDVATIDTVLGAAAGASIAKANS